MLEKMEISGVCPDVLSYSYVISACVRARKVPPFLSPFSALRSPTSQAPSTPACPPVPAGMPACYAGCLACPHASRSSQPCVSPPRASRDADPCPRSQGVECWQGGCWWVGATARLRPGALWWPSARVLCHLCQGTLSRVGARGLTRGNGGLVVAGAAGREGAEADADHGHPPESVRLLDHDGWLRSARLGRPRPGIS